MTGWGATDAIRCTGTGGSSTIFAVLDGVSVNAKSVSDQGYVHSIYIRNDGANAINITNNNLGSVEYVQSGESRRVVLKNKGNGSNNLQFNFRTAAAGDAIDITYWHPKIELGNVATDWTPAPEDVDSDFSQLVTDIGGEIDDLQSQIDGNITTWFYDPVPTTSNAPAVGWATTDAKNQHLGDLYYDASGYCYRWQLSGGVYGWTRITDTDVTTALANAKTAQDTADGKRRVFVTTPVPPYDVGDMWAQGTGGDLMRCATAKSASKSYSASDWVKASKYTDDTAVNNLRIGGRNLVLQSATKLIGAYGETTSLSFEKGVAVSEWSASDAIRCFGTGGTTRLFGTLGGVSVSNTSVKDQEYVHSIYIRNDGDTSITVSNHLSVEMAVASGECQRVVLKGKGNGSNYLMLKFSTATAGDAIDFTYWHPQIEMGNVVTDWTAAPEDDAEIFTGSNPPELPIVKGTLWIDTGVSPTVIRRWKGTGTSTDRDEDGWDTVNDLEEINEISNRLIAQQAEAQKAIDQLATAITIDTSGAHFYKPGYRDRSEVRIDQDSVDILVGGNVNSSFIAGGLILGNYMLWHPEKAGGLAFNLM